jgi:predicted DNA-binding WGR domain protein
MPRYEFRQGSSSKFWQIQRDGKAVTTTYGRIGAAGQTTLKEFDSEEKAQKEYDRLVAEKTKKGYLEASQGGPVAAPVAAGGWEGLAAMQPGEAFKTHFAFLVQTPACAELLTKLAERVREVRVKPDGLDWVLGSQYGKDTVVACKKPYDEPVGKSVPKTVAAVLSVHNGIEWQTGGGGSYGFMGVHDGRFIGSGNWEYDALEEAGEDNEAFLVALEDKELSPEDVDSPISYGQNWIIWNPAQKNALGEPAYFFVSHGDCVAVEIKAAKPLSFGALLLRVMSDTIAGTNCLAECYC